MFLRVLGLSLLPATAFAQGVPADPLMRFTFDDTLGVGQVIQDESSNTFDAWSVMDPLRDVLPGALGEVMAFDGRKDHVVLPTDAIRAVADLGSGSIFVRFMYEDLIPTQGVIPLVYVGQAAPADHVESMLIVEVGHGTAVDNHRLYFTWVIDGALALCFDTAFDVAPGEMHSFVGIVRPTGNTGFLNGRELTERHYNFGDKTTSVFFDDLPLRSLEQFTIGHGKGLDGLTPDMVNLRGLVDEVQIFDRALTGAEAMALTTPVP